MATYAVTTKGTALEIDTQDYGRASMSYVDANHFIVFWYGTNVQKTQVLAVNTSTWAVTTAAASLQYDATAGADQLSCCQIDTNHYLNIYQGGSADGFAQVFTVNTTTYAVSTANSALEIDTQNLYTPSVVKVDDTHFLAFWSGNTGTLGQAQVLTVNTTTWAVTTAAARLQWEATLNYGNFALKVDTNHFINWYGGPDSDGFVNTFTVNTTNWTVTTASTPLEFETTVSYFQSARQIDANHFICFFDGAGNDGFVQVFTVNTTTWAVTTANASLEFDTNYGNEFQAYTIDSTHYFCTWSGSTTPVRCFAQVFTVNTSTWAVTTAAASLNYDTNNSFPKSVWGVDTNHFISTWHGAGGDGFTQILEVELPASGPANLKTYNTNTKANIKTINTNPIANVKTLNTNA